MRAFLIDPVAKTVEQVAYSGDYNDIYRLTDCETFTVVGFGDDGSAVFVDDEGLLKDQPGPFFQVQGSPDMLAGKGLVLGTDDEGESVAATLTLDEMRALVTFPDIEFVGFDPIPEGTTTMRYGVEWPVFGQRAVFKTKAP